MVTLDDEMKSQLVLHPWSNLLRDHLILSTSIPTVPAPIALPVDGSLIVRLIREMFLPYSRAECERDELKNWSAYSFGNCRRRYSRHPSVTKDRGKLSNHVYIELAFERDGKIRQRLQGNPAPCIEFRMLRGDMDGAIGCL